MTTAQTMITTALQKLLVVKPGAAASAAQLALGLIDLNDLLKSWRQYGLTTWARRSQTFNLTVAKTSYTLGSGGDVVMTRPVEILGGYVTRDEVDIPLTHLGKTDWVNLANKTLAGVPTQFWYDPQLTRGVFYPWPVPDETGLTITLDYHLPLTAMVAADTIDMPDEWAAAVKFNLAVHMAPGTGRSVPQEVAALAQATFYEALSSSSEGASIFLEPGE